MQLFQQHSQLNLINQHQHTFTSEDFYPTSATSAQVFEISITAKFYLTSGETLRIDQIERFDFDQILQLLSNNTNDEQQVTIQYLDSDFEWVTCASDDEWSEAVKLQQQELKLQQELLAASSTLYDSDSGSDLGMNDENEECDAAAPAVMRVKVVILDKNTMSSTCGQQESGSQRSNHSMLDWGF